MRLTILVPLLLAVSGTHASWFGSEEPSYTTWNTAQLKQWLDDNHITTPSNPSHNQLVDLVKSNWNTASAWTSEQYYGAQKAFGDMRENVIDSWDESRLREFLLEQGIVAPSGPREELALLAKQRYRSYTDAAASFSASGSASLSSIAAQATKSAQRTLDDSKDYVYSTWDDNRLRSYLEEKGVLKTKEQKTREELLSMMRDAYATVADPVWEAWSDSYIRDWLGSHNLVDTRSTTQKTRDEYVQLMKNYYYDVNDKVWTTWTDSQMRQWLIDNNVIKSDAQVKREKMVKLVSDNYINARDTFWDAWSDLQIREWLVEHGYLKSDAQKKRDELVKLISDKYTNVADRTADYLTWPDARLRAYLREHGFPEQKLPRTRQGLLQETRIRYVQTHHRAESFIQSIMEVLEGTVGAAEDKVSQVLAMLKGNYEGAKGTAKGEWDEKSGKAKGQYESAKGTAEKEYEQKKGKAYEKAEKVKGEL